MNTPIKPEHINIDYSKGFTHLWNAFDNSETETSAYWLVKLAQRRGNWDPFTTADIQALYHEKFPSGTYYFNQLIDRGYIKQSGDTYEYTVQFVARCYSSSPVSQ